MDLKRIRLSEIGQAGKDRFCMVSLIYGIWGEKVKLTETVEKWLLGGWGK